MRAPTKQANDYYWNKPDKEWLEQQSIKLGKTATQIAKELDCDTTTVIRWLRGAGVEVGPPIGAGRRKYPKLYDEEWLEHQYVDLGKSSGQIKRELGVKSHITVCLCLRRAGIEIRSPQERGKRHSKRMSGSKNPSYNGGTSRKYQERKLREHDPDEMCEWCGSRENVEIHHIDHDTENGDLDNLMWLCHDCNHLEAYLYHLIQDGRASAERMGNTLTIRFKKEARSLT